jgi:hypothetical protein
MTDDEIHAAEEEWEEWYRQRESETLDDWLVLGMTLTGAVVVALLLVRCAP